jgi:hypothetical protein
MHCLGGGLMQGEGGQAPEVRVNAALHGHHGVEQPVREAAELPQFGEGAVLGGGGGPPAKHMMRDWRKPALLADFPVFSTHNPPPLVHVEF